MAEAQLAPSQSHMPLSNVGIRVQNLYKIFGATPKLYIDAVKSGMSKSELNEKHGHILGLKNINLTMPGGGIQVIMGLSGSGKSTLIRHINRLIDPTAGELWVGSDNVVGMGVAQLRRFRREKTAMVFQKFALLPHRTVYENTVYGLELQGAPKAKQQEAAAYWIDRVGMAGFEDKYPNQLSGGMQQRVGLARALANDAPILLMDEAFSALDPLIRLDMQSVLLDLQKEVRKTIVFITHDLDEALRLGDRIAILRDGEVVQDGTGQEIVLSPADGYIENFVREVNRAKVIQIESVMGTLGSMPRDGAADGSLPLVRLGTTIDDVAQAIMKSGALGALVCDEQGKPIGYIDIHSCIRAMTTPEKVD